MTRKPLSYGPEPAWLLDWIVSPVVAGLLLFLPFYLFWNEVSLVAIANESLSYRYFYSLRLLEGDGAGLVFPQGHGLTTFHHLVNLFLTFVLQIPMSELSARLEIFGYATLMTNTLLLAFLVFLIASSRRMEAHIKLMLYTLLLSFPYMSRSGISAFFAPDAYALEAVLTGYSVYAFVHLSNSFADRAEVRVPLSIGILAGLMMTTKISMIPTAVFPMLAVAASLAGLHSRLIKAFLFFGAATIATVGVVLSAFYVFRFGDAYRSLKLWATFVGNPGSEPGFWDHLLRPWLIDSTSSGAAYGYALIAIPGCIGIILASLVFTLRYRGSFANVLIVSTPLATSLLSLYFLYHRPAGTTLWEISLHITAAAVIAIVALRFNPERRALAYVFLVLLIPLTAWSAITNSRLIIDIDRFRASSQAVWEIHEQVRLHPKILVVIPDNDHTTGTVEEGLMKGISDFPTWRISSGQGLLTRTAPNVRFTQNGSVLTADHAVMWIDVAGGPFLADTMRPLGLRLEAVKGQCQFWQLETQPWWRRRVTICPAVSN